MDHRGGDRVIQGDDWIVGDAPKETIEPEDLRPIRFFRAFGFVVHGGDRSLQLVRAHGAARQRRREERHPFGDRGLVPERSILLVEGNELARRTGACRAPCIGEEHEREEPRDLRVFGEETQQHAREPKSLVREVRTMKLLGRGPLERNTGRLDALLRSADPLRHRRFGNEEGLGDLGRRKPSDRAEGEGDRRRRLAVTACALGANVIGDASGSDVDQPTAWIFRRAVDRPLRRRGHERILHGVLRGGEITKSPHDRSQHLRRERTQEMLGRGLHDQPSSFGGALITCRTSMAMFIGLPAMPGAADASAAIA